VYAMKKARVLRVEARRRPVAAGVTARSAWDWYAESCSCGLPSGDRRAHPRARPSQRLPAGDWRVWILIDALRGGIRDAFPEGPVPQRDLRSVHASRVMG